jgi:AcrR family transcriptional regulator
MATIVTPEDYFEGALHILSTEGHSGLKMTPLCQRLGVTSGSFYHYFGNWGCFKTAFLQDWLDKQTTQLAEYARSESDATLRLRVLLDLAVSLPHGAEAAIRAWAYNDPEVGAMQAVVDGQRYEASLDCMREMIGDDAEAENYARTGIYTLVGFQQVDRSHDPEHLRWAFEDLMMRVADAGVRARALR